jgi:hypothetical protein
MNNDVPPGYEQFWNEAALVQVLNLSIDMESSIPVAPKKARTPSPELSDGQISIALEGDLLRLIENITEELSRTTTGATSIGSSVLEVSPTSSGGMQEKSEFPPRASSLPVTVSSGVPPRSSTGQSSRKAFVTSLGPTFEDTLETAISFPPIAPLRSGRYLQNGSISRMTSNRTDSTGSRTLSTASDVEPLPQVLHALDDEPDDCVIVVRRITRLGFKSNRIIKVRLEQMGWEVRNVVLLPSRSRPMDGSVSGGIPHARPSSMGFVVFAKPQHAKECLSLGHIDVEGIEVLVQPFTRQYKPTTARESS